MNTVKVELTDEYRKKLRGALGFDVSSTFIYVPRIYRDNVPKDLWPVFILTSKDGVETSELEDSMGEVIYDGQEKTSRMKINTGSQRVKTLEIGIQEIKRFPLENGNLVYFDRKAGTLTVGEKKVEHASVRDALRYIPPAVQADLQNAINERKMLTEEELTGLEF